MRVIFGGLDPELSEDLFVDGVVRTVAAFLNSPRVIVGRLVIGALELTGPLERARESSEQVVRERLDSYAQIGRYLITGIEPDLQALRAAGKNVRDIDELMRNVQQRLDSALVSQSGGKAGPSIDISQEKLEGHTLMVVRVSTAAPGIWFHYHAAEDHGEIFTVRIG